MKLYAIIRQTDLHPQSRHFVGLPAELHPTRASPEPLAWPRVAIIDAGSEGVFLDRFTDDGSSVGDTWHQSVEDAKAQAITEYDGVLSEWSELPSQLDDEAAIQYALARALEA